MSNKIWRYSAGKRGESPAISGAARPVTAIIDFTRIVGDEGRVLRAVRAGLIVAGGSAGSILGGPSNRSRTLVGGLSLVKKDRALELGWVEIKPRPRDSCQEESPSAEHQLRSNGPGDQRPAACIENVENQCSPKNRCRGEKVGSPRPFLIAVCNARANRASRKVLGASWLFRHLPLRERVGRRVAPVSSTLRTRRLVVPSPPLPNPLPVFRPETWVARVRRHR